MYVFVGLATILCGLVAFCAVMWFIDRLNEHDMLGCLLVLLALIAVCVILIMKALEEYWSMTEWLRGLGHWTLYNLGMI